MIRAELRSLLARKLRTVLTMIAIILGVSMISGTYVLTDTINASFNQIFKQATAKIDATVTGKALLGQEPGSTPSLPAFLLGVVRRTPGVALADGEIADSAQLYSLSRTGPNGALERTSLGSAGGSPSLLFAVGDRRFNTLTLVRGRWPNGFEIALDQSTVSRHNLRLGQRLAVVTSNHALRTFTIAGVTRFGSVGSVGGATLIDMDLNTAQLMTGKQGRFDQIAVMAERGVSQRRAARAIRAHIPAAWKSRAVVRTGTEQANQSASEISQALNFLTIGLLAFAGVAVFVGAFIIFNTFSITVAQRAREFALFRTLGSSRRQILTSVVLEALFVGLAASVLGLLAGLGIARGLNQLFKLLGADLPSAGMVLQNRTIAVGMMVGTVVTVAAALMPAVRATRVPPISALREGVSLPKGRFSRLTPIISAVVTIVGLLITSFGIFGSISSAGSRLSIIGLGCVLLFLGVAMFSPQLVKPLAAAVGWPLQRFTAVTGRLARDNATRNPSRTAITAAALMVGLALVGFVTIFAAELKRTASDAVNREVAGTFLIQNSLSNENSIQPAVLSDVSRVPGVSLTSGLAQDRARVFGIGNTQVDGVDTPTFGQVYRFQWKQGSTTTLTSLGSHDALVSDEYASSNHLRIGSTIRLLTGADIRDSFTIHGIFKSSQLLSPLVIPLPTFRQDWQQKDLTVVAVNASPGVNQPDLEKRISNSLNISYPYLSVSSQAEYKAQSESHVNILLALIYVLLGLSILVSLFGIINTLVLSIYERTREIGMLRAIGTTRTQIRWMIRWESVITSLIGAVLGLALGIALAILITLGLQGQGIEFAFPVGQLLLFLVFAIIFGIVAAAFPARRAARLDVLEAVAYE